jgi:hypothetical protein
MRNLLVGSLIFCAFVASGQNDKPLIDQLKLIEGDSIKIHVGQHKIDNVDFKVFYNTQKEEQKPTFYINGKFLGSSLFFDSKKIEKIEVKKVNIEVDGILYYGQIYITTTENCHPNFITLAAIEKEYLGKSEARCIIMIDSKIVKEEHTSVFIDKNYILKIEIEKVDAISPIQAIATEKIDFINIFTITEENIKKSEEIRIR